MGRDALSSPQVGVTWIRLPAGASTQGEKAHHHEEQTRSTSSSRAPG